MCLKPHPLTLIGTIIVKVCSLHPVPQASAARPAERSDLKRLAISIAVTAHSKPLLPALPPALSKACTKASIASILSVFVNYATVSNPETMQVVLNYDNSAIVAPSSEILVMKLWHQMTKSTTSVQM